MPSADEWRVWRQGECLVYDHFESLKQGDYIYLPDSIFNANYRVMIADAPGAVRVINNSDAPPKFRTHLLLEGFTNV